MTTIKSIEEKARRYDKALERANKLKETCDSNAVVGWMEYIFPELKESGDIRKRIIDALHGDVLEMGEIKKAIAWLEKQGKLMKCLQIANSKIGDLIEENYYLRENLDKQGEQNPVIKMKTPEESLGVDSDTYNKIVDECIYGKQKPAEWHREDEQNLNACLGYIQDEFLRRWLTDIIHVKYDEHADLPKGEDYGIDGLYAAIDILQKTLGEVDGYQSDDGILTHKCAISAVKELSKQNPAWSEEDIELLDNTIKFIEDRVAETSPSLRTYSPTLTGKEIPFLKALKDRVQPQPKQEWSEEDERLFQIIIDIFDRENHLGNLSHTDLIACVKKLKSLRPQSQWKPSDEQMDALRYVTNFDYGGYKATLVSLYEQLKKLRGE